MRNSTFQIRKIYTIKLIQFNFTYLFFFKLMEEVPEMLRRQFCFTLKIVMRYDSNLHRIIKISIIYTVWKFSKALLRNASHVKVGKDKIGF